MSVLGIGRESRCGVGEEEGEVGLNYMDCLCFFNSVSQVRISPPFSISFFIFYFFNVLIYFSSICIRRLANFGFKKKKKNWKRHMIYLGMWQLL